MRVPWMQVAAEVVEHDAAQLAASLDWREDSAGWGLMKLFHWALRQADESKPPSLSALISGDDAAKVVARMAGWRKSPAAWFAAVERLPEPPAERVPGGVRLHGLRRYDAAWLKNQSKECREAWQAFLDGTGPNPALLPSEPAPEPARVSSGTGAEPERNRSGTVPEPEPQKQKQIQTQKPLPSEVVEEAAPPPPPEPKREAVAPSAVALVAEKPTAPVETWDADDFWQWAQYERQTQGGYLPERRKPRGLSAWYSGARMTPGVTTGALMRGFAKFCLSKHWESADPPYPFDAFISQWDQFTQPEVKRHAVSR